MITGLDATQTSLLRYCNNGEFAIGAGDGKKFTEIYYKQNIPYFDVTDTSYWLVDKSLYRPEEGYKRDESDSPKTIADIKEEEQIPQKADAKKLKSITVFGKVNLENYNQVFTSFIMPLQSNKIEIEIKVKGNSTKENPITENSSQYKITKESAKQLGLKFETEE